MPGGRPGSFLCALLSALDDPALPSINWSDDGKAIVIRSWTEFLEGACPKLFPKWTGAIETRTNTAKKAFNNYGFIGVHANQENIRSSQYSLPDFVKADRASCLKIERVRGLSRRARRRSSSSKRSKRNSINSTSDDNNDNSSTSAAGIPATPLVTKKKTCKTSHDETAEEACMDEDIANHCEEAEISNDPKNGENEGGGKAATKVFPKPWDAFLEEAVAIPKPSRKRRKKSDWCSIGLRVRHEDDSNSEEAEIIAMKGTWITVRFLRSQKEKSVRVSTLTPAQEEKGVRVSSAITTPAPCAASPDLTLDEAASAKLLVSPILSPPVSCPASPKVSSSIIEQQQQQQQQHYIQQHYQQHQHKHYYQQNGDGDGESDGGGYGVSFLPAATASSNLLDDFEIAETLLTMSRGTSACTSAVPSRVTSPLPVADGEEYESACHEQLLQGIFGGSEPAMPSSCAFVAAAVAAMQAPLPFEGKESHHV